MGILLYTLLLLSMDRFTVEGGDESRLGACAASQSDGWTRQRL